jgi:hypothetical protein
MINVGLISLRLPSILRFRRVKKSRKRGPHQEEEGTKYTKGLFPLRVPSLLCFLRAGKEETTAQRFREIGILIMVVRETRTMA